jgi:hypothetical protein
MTSTTIAALAMVAAVDEGSEELVTALNAGEKEHTHRNDIARNIVTEGKVARNGHEHV